MVYEKEDSVLASECGSLATLSLLGAVEKVQDHVCEFFGQLGIDQRNLRKNYNSMWVFVRNKIVLTKELDWGERFTVKCFITKISTLTMQVDTVFITKSGEQALYSRIEICLLDFLTSKLKRISEIGDLSLEMIESPLLNLEFNKLRDAENAENINQIRVGASSIDFCKHTNNTQYVKYVIDSLSVSELEKKRPQLIEIAYVAQSRENDVLDIFKTYFEGGNYYILKKGNEVVARCLIK